MYIIDLFGDSETIVVTDEVKKDAIKQHPVRYAPVPELQIVQIDNVDNEK